MSPKGHLGVLALPPINALELLRALVAEEASVGPVHRRARGLLRILLAKHHHFLHGLLAELLHVLQIQLRRGRGRDNNMCAAGSRCV